MHFGIHPLLHLAATFSVPLLCLICLIYPAHANLNTPSSPKTVHLLFHLQEMLFPNNLQGSQHYHLQVFSHILTFTWDFPWVLNLEVQCSTASTFPVPFPCYVFFAYHHFLYILFILLPLTPEEQSKTKGWHGETWDGRMERESEAQCTGTWNLVRGTSPHTSVLNEWVFPLTSWLCLWTH